MVKDLKKRAVNGLVWSFIDNFAVQASQFAIGIVLARLLTPSDFGLIGMITVFISLSQWFVSSGFGQALIRKKNANQADYSTIFIFNILSGIILYLVLFFSAETIADFFKEDQLVSLIKVLGINLIIISFTIVQQTQLTKRLDFKLQTKISVISSIIAGIVAIVMAFQGFGVWSLVYKSLLEYTLISGLLWIFNKWRPSFIFDKNSFKELFGFGSKLMGRGIIYTISNNLYYVVIGKYFSTADLGFFTRAEQFNRLPSSNINKVINRVSYPVLSELQDDKVRLKKVYRKIFRSLVFITSVSMLTLGAIAEPLIISLLTEKWRGAIVFLQLLSVVGLFFPLCDFNLTILKVVGKTGLMLKLEIFKRLLSVPVIIFGIFYGILEMIIGMIILSIFEFLINGYFSGKEISYPIKEQLRDVTPGFTIGATIGVSIMLINNILYLNHWLLLGINLIVAIILLFALSEIFKVEAYLNIKVIFIEKTGQLKKNKLFKSTF